MNLSRTILSLFIVFNNMPENKGLNNSNPPFASPAHKATEGHSKATEDKWWQPAVMMFIRLSAWIVAPVLLATLIGKWLDNKLDSAPWGLIGIVGISFVISMTGLIIETTKEYKKIEKSQKSK